MWKPATLWIFLNISVLPGSSFAPNRCKKDNQCTTTPFGHEKSECYSSNRISESQQQDLKVPLNLDEMVRQVSASVKEAARKGCQRQIIRVLLPRDATSGDFGTYLESSSSNSDSSSNSAAASAVSLVPPDESWQGGIMQLYRAAAPTCYAILRRLTQDAESGLPPRVKEDRSVDESGVDGVGLFATDDGQVRCWVQPTQELVGDCIRSADQLGKDQLVVLMNPQWRLVDDALDTASKGEGFLSNLASFLGGKGGALKQLASAGFQPVYTLEGYVCRGSNVRLMQCFGSSWNVFCERDDGENYLLVGSSPTRPSYQNVEKMLSDAKIGYKYARDIGLEPKL